MTKDPRRITLICARPSAQDRGWRLSGNTATRNITVNAFSVLTYALHNGVTDMHEDVERVVLDRATTPAGFLDLLTALPQGFTGDVLHIREDGSAYLSATGRGGDRLLYSLVRDDVDFYLETHDLVEPFAEEQRKSA